MLTRNRTLRNDFSSILLYCSVKSAHVLSVQKQVSFFGDMLFWSNNEQMKDSCDKYTWEGSNVFLKLIFTIHNKSHFLYHLHGTIFLRFKKIWNETESLIVSQLVLQLCWKVTFLTYTSSKFLKISLCPVNLPTMRLHHGHFPRNFPSFFVTVT